MTVGARTQYIVRVDDEDYDFLMGFRWTFAVSHQNGQLVYARRSVWEAGYNRTVFMHHMVLARKGLVRPSNKHTCDHHNGDSLDNRRGNLFWRTAKEQMANRRGIRAVPLVLPASVVSEIPY